MSDSEGIYPALNCEMSIGLLISETEKCIVVLK